MSGHGHPPGLKEPHPGLIGKVISAFIDSKLTPMIIVASLLLGVAASVMLPREEEPQIVVAMVDVMVGMPGASAEEVEQRVTRPLEKLFWEIPGVEYIYSTSSEGASLVMVRFEVGHSSNDALVNLNAKIAANMDAIPPGATQPLVKVRSIDDVPILALTFWGGSYTHEELRRLAAQVNDSVKQVEGVSETTLIGGYPRKLRVIPDQTALAARGFSLLDLTQALTGANQSLPAGSMINRDHEMLVETSGFLASRQDVAEVVIGAYNHQPVHVGDVARIIDGPDEPTHYVFIRETHRADAGNEFHPAVTLAVAKRKGTSAIDVADNVLRKIDYLKGNTIPSDIEISTTRNYGLTASEKANELLLHMGIAVVSVALLLGFILGWREAGVVSVAIPVTLALTLAAFYFLGFTLNRITLFALIFSIGILVDDPIVDVENIVRHLHLPGNHKRSIHDVAAEAVKEVGSPLILATLTVVAAILPMAFVRGLMGPYMRPIPIGASLAMFFSMAVAFVVTPWAAVRLLKGRAHETEGHSGQHEDWATRLYRRFMHVLLKSPASRWGFMLILAVLLIAAIAFVPLGLVRVKMLPYDNKSEFQVIIDMPEGTTLERTAAVARELAEEAAAVPEVRDVEIYAGTSSPYNFNGLVRHYFLRSGGNVGEIQVNLLPRHDRQRQSHDIARDLRPRLVRIADRYQARIKVAEVPPGPPVIQTLVAEVYGPDEAGRNRIARQVADIFRRTPGVVDVDTMIEDPQVKYRFDVDQEKAALLGVGAESIALNLRAAVSGVTVGLVHDPRERENVELAVRLPLADRSSLDHLKTIPVRTRGGDLVPLGELVILREVETRPSIHHKNLLPVAYVTADVSGEAESPVYALMAMDGEMSALKANVGPNAGLDFHYARQPFSEERYSVKWDGELHITYEVFRDLGLAFAAVLILVYVLVVGWFESFRTPMIIMAAIPFSLVGILPAHWMFGAFFSATSMIGFIAGAGIVVRNSIILVDFIELRRREGFPLNQAVIEAGAVRFRPMVLTAAAVVVGASVILFDPIFQGLAISLMAGEVASLLLSRMAVPVLYYMGNRDQPASPGTA